MQTRLSSLIEALIGTAIGFLVSLLITAWLLPQYGHAVSWSDNFQITGVFTIASVLRSYLVRRFFNTYIHAAALRLATKANQYGDL